MAPFAVDFAAAGLFGGLVGMGELVARYRDAPGRALRSWPAATYIFVNAAASIFALWLAQVYGWTFGADPGTDQARITMVLIAGFGSLAFFRSSLFMVRVGDDDIGVGPIAFLQVILAATDRGVDRNRAVGRAIEVSRAMEGLKFADVEQSLPTYALMLTQSVPVEDQVALGDQVKKLSSSTMSDQTKVLGLGLLVMNYVGTNVLAAAVEALRRETSQSSRSGVGVFSGRRGRDARDFGNAETSASSSSTVAPEAAPSRSAADGSGPQPGAAPPGTAVGSALEEVIPIPIPEPEAQPDGTAAQPQPGAAPPGSAVGTTTEAATDEVPPEREAAAATAATIETPIGIPQRSTRGRRRRSPDNA
jgi:hypothetical protein